jgi:hypothetical protein
VIYSNLEFSNNNPPLNRCLPADHGDDLQVVISYSLIYSICRQLLLHAFFLMKLNVLKNNIKLLLKYLK